MGTRKFKLVEEIEGGRRPETVREFAVMFEHIFSEHNRHVGYTSYDLLSRLTEEVLDCLTPIAKYDMAALDVRVPKMHAWLHAAANCCGIDLQASLWHKYPGVCNRCFAEENCGCVVQKTKYDPRHPKLAIHRRDVARMPERLEDWQAGHRRIYGRINTLVGPFQVFSHLASEVREMKADFRLGRIEDMAGEAADVYFWIIAFANVRGVSLADATWRQYPYQCDTCHKQKCKCEKQ